MPFKEMTSHCEALSMGQQQKMSAFMSFKRSWQAAIPENNQISHPEAAHISNEQVCEAEQFTFAFWVIVYPANTSGIYMGSFLVK
jgi:hypothetical protein